MPVIDTNFLIYISHDETRAIRGLRRIAEERLIVPAQAAAEFLAGMDNRQEELMALHDGFEVAHTDDEHLLAMATLRSEMRTRSIRPRWGDVHIAAQAQIHGTYVVTNNARHFHQLGVETWDWKNQIDPPKGS